MLRKQYLGRISSWYIRFDYNLYKQQLLTFFPYQSKVYNDGFDDAATNTYGFNRYPNQMDDGSNLEFNFPATLHQDSQVTRQFLFRLSIPYRIYAQIRNRLNL